jgi:hypothetical protein
MSAQHDVLYAIIGRTDTKMDNGVQGYFGAQYFEGVSKGCMVFLIA